MGAPPAHHKQKFFNKKAETILPSFPKISFYKRYLDDVFGIWIPRTTQRWYDFIAEINNFYGMPWKISALSNQVDFLDLTTTLWDGVTNTNLFKKT